MSKSNDSEKPCLPTLCAGRICLRPWTQDDTREVWEAMQEGQDIQRYLPWTEDLTWEKTESFIQAMQQIQWPGRRYFSWAVCDPENPEHVFGCVDVTVYDHGRAMSGYWVRPSEQRKGYAQEALALVQQEVVHLGCSHWSLLICKVNQASQALAQRMGFKEIGQAPSMKIHRIDYEMVIFQQNPLEPVSRPAFKVR